MSYEIKLKRLCQKGRPAKLIQRFIDDRKESLCILDQAGELILGESKQTVRYPIEIEAGKVIGWVCGVAFAYHFVLQPIILFAVTAYGLEIPALPEFDMTSLMTVLGGMLGIGGLRTYEKQKGLTK